MNGDVQHQTVCPPPPPRPRNASPAWVKVVCAALFLSAAAAIARGAESDPSGPKITLGIEINLPHDAVFYVPVVGHGEMLAVIPVSKEGFAGIRIKPEMRGDGVQLDVSGLVAGGKKLSEAGCDAIRAWQSVDAGSYQGRQGQSLSLSGLAGLGLPALKVKVVWAKGPPPGPLDGPFAGSSAYCDCKSWLTPAKCSEGGVDGSERATPCSLLSYIGAGKCVQFSGCGQCCRISAPLTDSDAPSELKPADPRNAASRKPR